MNVRLARFVRHLSKRLFIMAIPCKECPVCLESYTTSEYKPLLCKHPLCDGCYNSLSSKQCPLCRADIGIRVKRFSRLSLTTTSFNSVENYYNNAIERLVEDAINHYNNTQDDDGCDINVKLTAYYYNGKEGLNIFKQLVPRINDLLYWSRCNHAIRCSFNTGSKDKKKSSDDRPVYHITYTFAFTR